MNKQEAKNKLKTILEEVEVLKEYLKNDTTEEEWPKVGDNYWLLSPIGIAICGWSDDATDKAVLKRGGPFRTKEEADLADQARIAVATIKRYAKKQWGEFKPDWMDAGEQKFFIWHGYRSGKYDVYCWPHIQGFSPIGYFREGAHAEEIIKKFQAELDIIRKFYT